MGAGVLVASFHRLQQVESRVSRRQRPHVRRDPSELRSDAERRAAFQEELARRLRTVPGVIAAGGISFLPATGAITGWNTSHLSGPRAGTSVTQRDGFNVQHRTVSGDVFAALEIPVLAGRTFDARDDRRAPSRAVVSANFARDSLSRDAVSCRRRSAYCGRRPPSLEIIGVVSDVVPDVYGGSTLVVYHAHPQFANNRNWVLSHVVATRRPPETILGDVRAAVTTLDPELVVGRAAPLRDGRRSRASHGAIDARPDDSLRGSVSVARHAGFVRCVHVHRAVCAPGDRDPDGPRRNGRSDTRHSPAAGRSGTWSRPAGRDDRCSGARTLAHVARL